MESLSTYARQFLEKMPRPVVDAIHNVPPAIALEQRNSIVNNRTTVATMTEVYDYLRILFARMGEMYCPKCHVPAVQQTTDQSFDSPELARAYFDQRHPRGYFAHRKAFSVDGLYGQWLLSLPAVIVINDTAFAHGGLPPLVATMNLAQLNRLYQDTVRQYLTSQGYTFPVTLQEPALRELFTTRRVIPMTCTIGRDGRLREAIAGEMFEEDVLKLASLAD